MDFIVELLDRHHDRSQFDCGSLPLNEYLTKYAYQNQKNNISKTFVALNSEEIKTKEICGFFTLSSGKIHFEQLPNSIKHPKYPVLIARLARLAVDKKYQGQGLGGYLLHAALDKARAAADVLGIFAIVVDAKDKEAVNFYQHYGFQYLNSASNSLFLPIHVIRNLSSI